MENIIKLNVNTMTAKEKEVILNAILKSGRVMLESGSAKKVDDIQPAKEKKNKPCIGTISLTQQEYEQMFTEPCRTTKEKKFNYNLFIELKEKGLTNKEISKLLGMSEQTLYSKLRKTPHWNEEDKYTREGRSRGGKKGATRTAEIKRKKKEERKNKVLKDSIHFGGTLQDKEMAECLGVTRGTLRNYKKELRAENVA